MAAGVRQRFLDDAVGAEPDRMRDVRATVRGHRELDVHSGTPARLDERGDVCELRLRLALSGAVAAQHAQHAAQIAQSLARRRAERGELLASGGAEAAHPIGRRLGLDGDQRHVVRDDVVHLAGYPGSLLEYRPARLVELAPGDLLCQRVACAAGAEGGVEGDRGDEENDGRLRSAVNPVFEPEPRWHEHQHGHRPGCGSPVAEAGDPEADEQRDGELEADPLAADEERDQDDGRKADPPRHERVTDAEKKQPERPGDVEGLRMRNGETAGVDGNRPLLVGCPEHPEERDGDERGTDPGGELDEGA